MANLFYPLSSHRRDGFFNGGSVFYLANDYTTTPQFISDDLTNRENSHFHATDGMEGTKFKMYSAKLTNHVNWFDGAHQAAYLDWDHLYVSDTTPDITHVAIGDGNAVTACDYFTVSGSVAGFNTDETTLFNSSTDGRPPVSDNGGTVFALTTTGTNYQYYRVAFFNVSAGAVLGNIMLGKTIELPNQTSPITLPVAKLCKQSGHTGANFIPQRTVCKPYNSSLKIPNATKAQVESLNEALSVKGVPYVWLSDGSEYAGGYMAFMYRDGLETIPKYNANNLIDINIPVKSRKW